MPFREAADNIINSYRFQLKIGGSRLPRLLYASAYWGSYLWARYIHPGRGTDPLSAHGAAMEFLGLYGLSNRLVRAILPDGTDFHIDLMTSFMILKELYEDDMYEIGPGGRFEISPRQIIFDVGAQQGVFTGLAARRADGGKVVSMEPEPWNFKLLKGNISRNNFSNVVTLPVAISDNIGRANLYCSRLMSGGHSLLLPAAEGNSVEVPVSTLDAVSHELRIGPDLLKIDVEGSTYEVLKGAAALLSRYKPNIVMEVEIPEQREGIKAMLLPLGYQIDTRGWILFARSPSR